MKKLLHVLYPATSFHKKGVLARLELLKSNKKKKKLRKVLLRITETPTFSVEEINGPLIEGDVIGENVLYATAIVNDNESITYVVESFADVTGAQDCCTVGIPPVDTHFLLHDGPFYLIDFDPDNGRVYLY
jgi:hypothetical protein